MAIESGCQFAGNVPKNCEPDDYPYTRRETCIWQRPTFSAISDGGEFAEESVEQDRSFSFGESEQGGADRRWKGTTLYPSPEAEAVPSR